MLCGVSFLALSIGLLCSRMGVFLLTLMKFSCMILLKIWSTLLTWDSSSSPGSTLRRFGFLQSPLCSKSPQSLLVRSHSSCSTLTFWYSVFSLILSTCMASTGFSSWLVEFFSSVQLQFSPVSPFLHGDQFSNPAVSIASFGCVGIVLDTTQVFAVSLRLSEVSCLSEFFEFFDGGYNYFHLGVRIHRGSWNVSLENIL